MKIINLLGLDFTKACQKLKTKVTEVYDPDLIIGIATGGAVVVNHMSFDDDKKIVTIKRQRPFTKTKKKIRLEVWLPYIPRSINNVLRVLELKFNEYKFNKKIVKIENKKNTLFLMKGSLDDINEAKKILVVDDSVDSGETLKECLDFIRLHAKADADVRTSSINVTFENPITQPTYTLYQRTIVRYPWASDVRGNDEKNSV